MRRVLVLGGGTAGTMAANKLRQRLDDRWQVTVVDRDDAHHYQPGYLFVPFGIYEPDEIVRSRRRFLADGVDFVCGEVDGHRPRGLRSALADGRVLGYDYLVIATGDHAAAGPDAGHGRRAVAPAASTSSTRSRARSRCADAAARRGDGGRLVVHITEMPIKCPVAPLEFTFLADAFFASAGMRDRSTSPT